jgi:hypothetical protein
MIMPFEDKIRLLDQIEKSYTGELIDQLLAKRRGRKQSAIPSNEEKLPRRLNLLNK